MFSGTKGKLWQTKVHAEDEVCSSLYTLKLFHKVSTRISSLLDCFLGFIYCLRLFCLIISSSLSITVMFYFGEFIYRLSLVTMSSEPFQVQPSVV